MRHRNRTIVEKRICAAILREILASNGQRCVRLALARYQLSARVAYIRSAARADIDYERRHKLQVPAHAGQGSKDKVDPSGRPIMHSPFCTMAPVHALALQILSIRGFGHNIGKIAFPKLRFDPMLEVVFLQAVRKVEGVAMRSLLEVRLDETSRTPMIKHCQPRNPVAELWEKFDI
nr:hypothetical protein CFP56_09703 [Quercus suber]